ncbi:MAG: ATP-binding protein [Patescibacteria group bacterium]
MNTSIFGKPLNEVTTDDVELFCKSQIKEGVNLDYKKDLSSAKSIVKAIASFANTRGGWILIGVEDDKDDKPVIPAVGIDFQDHLTLTVTNMVLSHMWPPVVPVYQVCPPDKNNKTFLIMYVPESHEAPHWLFNKKELYVRVSDRSISGTWEELATSEQWEWLRNKREKSTELRKEIKNELDYRFRTHDIWDELENGVSGSVVLPPPNRRDRDTVDMLNLTITPYYPTEAIMDVKQSYDLLGDVNIRDYYGTSNKYPAFLDYRNVFQNGTEIYRTMDSSSRKYFTALHTAGMIVYKETVVLQSNPPKESGCKPENYIELSRILARLDQFLTLANEIYKKVGFVGLTDFRVFINGIDWMRMIFPLNTVGDFEKYKSPTGDFYWTDTILASELGGEKNRYEVIKKTIESLMFMFGWKDFNWNITNNYYKSVNVFTSL